MPLLTVSCFSKIQIGFTFQVPAHPGSPGQRAVKWECVCVSSVFEDLQTFIRHSSELHSFLWMRTLRPHFWALACSSTQNVVLIPVCAVLTAHLSARANNAPHASRLDLREGKGRGKGRGGILRSWGLSLRKPLLPYPYTLQGSARNWVSWSELTRFCGDAVAGSWLADGRRSRQWPRWSSAHTARCTAKCSLFCHHTHTPASAYRPLSAFRTY